MDFKILLHPHRFMIVASLSEGPLTVKEMLKKMPDIPQAAMYRGVNKLEENNIINKVYEKKVKGTMEASYGLIESMEKLEIKDSNVQTYLKSATMVFFSFVFNKIVYKRRDKDQYSSLSKSRFNSFELKVKEIDMKALEEDLTSLLKKYYDSSGDVYQCTTFLVPIEKQ